MKLYPKNKKPAIDIYKDFLDFIDKNYNLKITMAFPDWLPTNSLERQLHDVYAKRWENKNKGTDGYIPCCLNEWKSELCRKPKVKCTACSNKAYARLDEKTIDDHLRGRGDLVVGIYPLCLDKTCYFLAIDFDDGEWQKDISQFREVCSEFDFPVAIERSRSRNGAHAWIFFERAIAATLARKLGSALLTYAMNKRHEITFKSYDRFFPNQDTMPKGGLGNLIALPLQKAARINNNSVFIDANFEPYNDQWEFMTTLQKLSEAAGTLDLLQVAGVSLVFKSNIHQKYAVIDQRIVWYGSINLLSFGSAEESIMRLDSPNIANELVMSLRHLSKELVEQFLNVNFLYVFKIHLFKKWLVVVFEIA